MTYRLHDHTTADDARRYRGEDEVKAGMGPRAVHAPAHVSDQGRLWDETQENAWAEDCGKRVDIEINAYLETPVQPVSAMFDFLYADLPPDVQAQRAEAIAAEGRKHG